MSSHGRSGGGLIRPQHRNLMSNKNHNCNARQSTPVGSGSQRRDGQPGGCRPLRRKRASRYSGYSEQWRYLVAGRGGRPGRPWRADSPRRIGGPRFTSRPSCVARSSSCLPPSFSSRCHATKTRHLRASERSENIPRLRQCENFSAVKILRSVHGTSRQKKTPLCWCVDWDDSTDASSLPTAVSNR